MSDLIDRKAEVFRLALMGAPADIMRRTVLQAENVPHAERRLAQGEVPEVASIVAHFEQLTMQRQRAERKAFWQLSVLRQLRHTNPKSGIDEHPGSIDGDSFYSEFYFSNRPVVLRNLLSSWTAFSEWSFDYLSRVYGHLECEVMLGHDGRYTKNIDQYRHRLQFGEVLRRVQAENEDAIYLIGQNRALRSSLRAVVDSLSPLPALLSDDMASAALWVGPKGTTTHLHYDPINIFHVQVLGSKRFVLIPPTDTCFVYNDRGLSSSVSVDAPDLAQHPLFPYADRNEIVLNAGDALFIPVGWWHFVRGLEASVSIGFHNFLHDNRYEMGDGG